jgi:hypothetical protein
VVDTLRQHNHLTRLERHADPLVVLVTHVEVALRVEVIQVSRVC